MLHQLNKCGEMVQWLQIKHRKFLVKLKFQSSTAFTTFHMHNDNEVEEAWQKKAVVTHEQTDSAWPAFLSLRADKPPHVCIRMGWTGQDKWYDKVKVLNIISPLWQELVRLWPLCLLFVIQNHLQHTSFFLSLHKYTLAEMIQTSFLNGLLQTLTHDPFI